MARDNKKPKQPSIYPWEKWLGKKLEPGSAWMVSKGHEYNCLSTSFRSQVHKRAREQGLAATSTVVGEYVLFVFYDPNSYFKPNMPALKDVRKARRKLGLD